MGGGRDGGSGDAKTIISPNTSFGDIINLHHTTMKYTYKIAGNYHGIFS